MAGRTTRKPKETADTGAAAKSLHEAPPKAVRKKLATDNRGAAKPRVGKPRVGKPRVGKPRVGKPRVVNPTVGKANGVKKKRATTKPTDLDTANALLIEQNEALRAELDHANARLTQLEELNKNVVNRIDWVIDSLQSTLTAKR
jgi:hypothetical protein